MRIVCEKESETCNQAHTQPQTHEYAYAIITLTTNYAYLLRRPPRRNQKGKRSKATEFIYEFEFKKKKENNNSLSYHRLFRFIDS